MNTLESIAQKFVNWWNNFLTDSQDLSVQFAPAVAPIDINLRRVRSNPRSTPRVINVSAYVDTRFGPRQ